MKYLSKELEQRTVLVGIIKDNKRKAGYLWENNLDILFEEMQINTKKIGKNKVCLEADGGRTVYVEKYYRDGYAFLDLEGIKIDLRLVREVKEEVKKEVKEGEGRGEVSV